MHNYIQRYYFDYCDLRYYSIDRFLSRLGEKLALHNLIYIITNNSFDNEMSEWLPYNETWKGNILETIIIKGIKNWEEILNKTGLYHEQLNIALSELYNEGIIQKEADGPYWMIPEIYGRYKRYYEGLPKPIEEVDKESKVVFVVSRRNEKACEALFTFLRLIGLQPLKFSEAIFKTGKVSPYIGKILESAFSFSQAVVVLMILDDEECLREPYRESGGPSYEKQLTSQARSNVLFEAGMAMGKFPYRIILIELGELCPFSDIGGHHTIKLDNSIEKRKDLAQRLKSTGCPVSLIGSVLYK